MDQQDRPNPRRRLAIVGAALLASLAIAVPAAFAASGGDAGSTPTQTQPAVPSQQQDAPHERGDHRGPCPGHGGGQQGQGSSDSSGADAPQSSDVAFY
jgi:hypothetical protein